MPPKTDVWSLEAEILLIEAVQARPMLWDCSLLDYRKTDLKERQWEDMAAIMGSPFTVDQVKKRFSNMKGTFQDNERRVKDSKRSGSGADNVFRPKWHLYERLLFLRKASASAASTSNLPTIPASAASTSNLSTTPARQGEQGEAFALEDNADFESLLIHFDEHSQMFRVISDTNTSCSSIESPNSSSPIASPLMSSLLAPSRPASAPPSSASRSGENKRAGDEELCNVPLFL